MPSHQRRLFGLLLALCAVLPAPTFAECRRDREAVREFRAQAPCPATGRTHGACKGWEVDHVEPLKCGGADDAANMQWLTVEAHKAKTRREARHCRPAICPRKVGAGETARKRPQARPWWIGKG